MHKQVDREGIKDQWPAVYDTRSITMGLQDKTGHMQLLIVHSAIPTVEGQAWWQGVLRFLVSIGVPHGVQRLKQNGFTSLHPELPVVSHQAGHTSSLDMQINNSQIHKCHMNKQVSCQRSFRFLVSICIPHSNRRQEIIQYCIIAPETT